MDESDGWLEFQPQATSLTIEFRRDFFGERATQTYQTALNALQTLEGRRFVFEIDDVDEPLGATISINPEPPEFLGPEKQFVIYPSISIVFEVQFELFDEINNYWRLVNETDVQWTDKVDFWLQSGMEDIGTRRYFILALFHFMNGIEAEYRGRGNYAGQSSPINIRRSYLLKYESGHATEMLDAEHCFDYYNSRFLSGDAVQSGAKYYFEEMLIPTHHRDIILDISFIFSLFEVLLRLSDSGKVNEIKEKLHAIGLQGDQAKVIRESYQLRSAYVHGHIGAIDEKKAKVAIHHHAKLVEILRHIMRFMFSKDLPALEFVWRLKA
jgi:hypothetical protein